MAADTDLPYSQQDDESARAFQAFVAYRSLPASMRSIDTAWRRSVSLTGAPGSGAPSGRAPATWRDWSAKYAWVARASAWDAEKDRQAQSAQILEHKAMLDRHSTIGQGLIAKATQAMSMTAVADLGARDVATWIKVGTELERKSRLIPDQIVEHRGTVAHEGSLSVDHSSSTYDAIVEVLLHGPAEAIRAADHLSGRVAPDSGSVGPARDDAPRRGSPVEASGPP